MQNDKEALGELIGGVMFIAVTIGAIMFLVMLFSRGNETPASKFEVVDKYEQCDVVRYTDKTERWHYFLHCPNQ